MPFMTIPIALAITGAATAGTEAYQIHSAGATNKRSLDAQTAADQRQAAIEQQKVTDAKAAFDTRAAADKARWSDYLRVNEPYWQAGAGVLKSLYGLAGEGGQAPAYQAYDPNTPPPTTAAAPVTADGPVQAPTPSSTGHGFQPIASPSVKPISMAALMALAQSAGANGAGSPNNIPAYSGTMA